MKISSKYFDGIRISSTKKNEPSKKESNCQWKGCKKKRSHRAPVGRGQEGEYYNFCLDHVKAYNKSFNYFAGLSDAELVKFQKDAVEEGQPTWIQGTNGSPSVARTYANMRSGSAAYFRRITNPNAILNSNRPSKSTAKKLKPLEEKALLTLGLDLHCRGQKVRNRYKELVKMHHPDANGGDRSLEDRFCEIVNAYQILKQADLC